MNPFQEKEVVRTYSYLGYIWVSKDILYYILLNGLFHPEVLSKLVSEVMEESTAGI